MGNKATNIIEINGKRYDAITGTFLGDAAASSKVVAKPAARSVDGFTQTSSSRTLATAPVKITARKPHTPGVHVRPHKPEPAKTLMRTAVKKPEIKAPSHIKSQTPTDIMARVPGQVVAPKLSHTSVDPRRLKKATQIIKSPVVSRYGSSHAIAQDFTASSLLPKQSTTTIRTPRTAAAIPVTPVRNHTKQPDIFEQALARAKSHEQIYHEKPTAKKRRGGGLVTATLCLLLIAGLVAYFNAPVLSLRLASTRVGFSAKLPGYSPVGYSFGDLSYGDGKVTVNYTSEDAQSFNIVQRASDWDSQALLSNFVTSANKAYQTYERAGRTIYFYGENTATWVDSGVWYTVNGNSSLTKGQLLDLAGSI